MEEIKRCVDCFNFKTRIIHRKNLNSLTSRQLTKPLEKRVKKNQKTQIWYCYEDILPRPVYLFNQDNMSTTGRKIKAVIQPGCKYYDSI